MGLLAALRKGGAFFNSWRKKNRRRSIDLIGANLDGLDLESANLRFATLRHTSLRNARMSFVKLDGARIYNSDLTSASLCDASLQGCVVGHSTCLESTDFSQASLFGTLFHDCDFRGSRMDAILVGVEFSECNMDMCDFAGAVFDGTVFNKVDLSNALGLTGGDHYGPTSFDIETLRRSRGRIPGTFLKCCGLSDTEVAMTRVWDPDLSGHGLTSLLYSIDQLRGSQPIQRHSVFISYSHADRSFAEQLHTRLDGAGVRCWRDVQDLIAGRLEKQIDRAIRLNSTVIVILSANSVESDWVEWETARAREVERDEKRDVLCPVALDSSWKSCNWTAPLRRQIMKYNIVDFGGWRDKTAFDDAFSRLLAGLDAFYRKT